METIAFIGTGVMGRGMASHLLSAGYPLLVYNRTREKADDLVSKGATYAESPSAAAAAADVIITMVGYPADVESLYLSPQGIVKSAQEGAILVDMTTSSPTLARRIAAVAAARGLFCLDAPVSGGDSGARNGTLSIMVGGDRAGFEKVLPIFAKMGSNVVLQGGPGAGQHCKMCNQIAIASTMMGVVESLAYGIAAGLDPRTMLKSIEAGAAGSWSLSNLIPRVLDGNLGPGFYVKHFIKDMNIALDSAQELGLSLPGLEKAEALYRRLAAMDRVALSAASADGPAMGNPNFAADLENGGDLGTQALYLLYAAGLA